LPLDTDNVGDAFEAELHFALRAVFLDAVTLGDGG
jgi:hypothetical protein